MDGKFLESQCFILNPEALGENELGLHPNVLILSATYCWPLGHRVPISRATVYHRIPNTYLKNISLLFFTCDDSHPCRLGFWWTEMFLLVCHCSFSEWLVRFILIGWAGTWCICTGMRQVSKRSQLLICIKKATFSAPLAWIMCNNLHIVYSFQLSRQQSYTTLNTQIKILICEIERVKVKTVFQIVGYL